MKIAEAICSLYKCPRGDCQVLLAGSVRMSYWWCFVLQVNTQLLIGNVFEYAPPQYLSCIDIVSCFYTQDNAFGAFDERASNCRCNKFSPGIDRRLTCIGLRYGNSFYEHKSKQLTLLVWIELFVLMGSADKASSLSSPPAALAELQHLPIQEM